MSRLADKDVSVSADVHDGPSNVSLDSHLLACHGKVRFFGNQEASRVVLPIGGLRYVVLKLFDAEQKEMWAIDIFCGDFNAVAQSWSTPEVSEDHFFSELGKFHGSPQFALRMIAASVENGLGALLDLQGGIR